MKINYWKVGVFAAIVLALMYWAHSCGVKSVIVKAGRVDTVWLKPDTVRRTDSVPKLVKVIKWMPHGTMGVAWLKPDTVTQPVDSAAILEAYNSTYLYAYQERMKYGVIQIDDTITQNMFLGRGVTVVYDSIPVVTKNNIIYPPRKPVFYFSLSAMANKDNAGGGVGFAYKAPNDKIYKVEAKVLMGKLFYEFEYAIPIQLKKN